jgi:hypothetical protein
MLVLAAAFEYPGSFCDYELKVLTNTRFGFTPKGNINGSGR